MSSELEALERLKWCPHCGPGQSVIECCDDDYGGFQVWCGRCGSSSGKSKARQSAIDSWNTRADPKPLPWLRAEEVTEEGVYWWKIKSNAKAIPIVVMRIKGQLYYDNRGWLFRMGTSKAEGLWQRIPEPELPKEGE